MRRGTVLLVAARVTVSAEECEGTTFSEMPFVRWRQSLPKPYHHYFSDTV
jgi:hypothetical protein